VPVDGSDPAEALGGGTRVGVTDPQPLTAMTVAKATSERRQPGRFCMGPLG
jgi:hypothetical protein